MTDDELLARLKAIHLGDPEAAHGEADDLLVEALRAAGFAKSADQYETMCQSFWYA